MKPKIKPVVTPARNVTMRNALKSDAALILSFIRELAEYEKLAHEVIADESTLAKHLFGSKPRAECLIAEADGELARFALFFHNFSTFLGKPGLYLEDLYVKPAYRANGIGIQLLRALAKIAIERNCGRMEWWVLDWNEPALKFYQKLGTEPMSDWTLQRLNRAEIEKLAGD